MRTTLTLDPDVVRLLEDEAHRLRKPWKQVVNDAVRKGLSHRTSQSSPGRYRVRPHQTTLRTGVDGQGFNRLADELEDEALVAKMQTKTPTKAPRRR